MDATLGHFDASSRAAAVVTRRQLLPPKPSVKPSLIFLSPHHAGTPPASADSVGASALDSAGAAALESPAALDSAAGAALDSAGAAALVLESSSSPQAASTSTLPAMANARPAPDIRRFVVLASSSVGSIWCVSGWVAWSCATRQVGEATRPDRRWATRRPMARQS